MVYLEIPNMSEHPIEKDISDVVQVYELLDRVRTRQDLVIRDDQFDFNALLEASRYADRRGIRLSALDTGRLGLDEVESLALAGARILTPGRRRAGRFRSSKRFSQRAWTSTSPTGRIPGIRQRWRPSRRLRRK